MSIDIRKIVEKLSVSNTKKKPAGRNVAFWLNTDVDEKLTKYCAKKKISKGGVIRELVKAFVSQEYQETGEYSLAEIERDRDEVG